MNIPVRPLSINVHLFCLHFSANALHCATEICNIIYPLASDYVQIYKNLRNPSFLYRAIGRGSGMIVIRLGGGRNYYDWNTFGCAASFDEQFGDAVQIASLCFGHNQYDKDYGKCTEYRVHPECAGGRDELQLNSTIWIIYYRVCRSLNSIECLPVPNSDTFWLQ